MWTVDSAAEVEAPPAAIWRLYADPATWASWAHSTAGASADGPLAVGTTVVVQPVRGPRQLVRIVAFEPERRLVSELALPGARMRFSYEIEPIARGSRVRHGVTMDGVLAAVYGAFMRSTNMRKLEAETSRLAAAVRAPG